MILALSCKVKLSVMRDICPVKTMNKTTSYTVLVEDNYDFYDEDERYCAGVYNSLDDALEKCLRIVGEYILEQDYPAMKAADLYESYTFLRRRSFYSRAGAGEVLRVGLR